MWEKIRVGHRNVYQYHQGDKIVATIFPEPLVDSNKKIWVCEFLDHKPFTRNSLKLGKKDIEFLWEQLTLNNLAIILDK